MKKSKAKKPSLSDLARRHSKRTAKWQRDIIRSHLLAAARSFAMAVDIDQNIVFKEMHRLAIMDPKVLKMRIKAGKL